MEKELINVKDIMNRAVEEARRTMNLDFGGPFGAAIVKDGQIITVSSNHVLAGKDPTAHAEMCAIRQACKKLDTYDLTGCEIYCTSEPCPMCLSAIIWANIKIAYFGCTAVDAANIGFRDDYIYDFIKNDCKNDNVLKMIPSSRNECIKLFEEYSNGQGTIY